MPKIDDEDRIARNQADLERYIDHVVVNLDSLLKELDEVRNLTLAYAFINAREYLVGTASAIERVKGGLERAAQTDETIRTKRSYF